MPDNVRAGQPDGKCHRKDTAPDIGSGNREQAGVLLAFLDCLLPMSAATVKWCGKSAPAAWRHVGLVNPIGSKAE